ncbi:MAG: zinc-ribbon domain-containing protein [Candidatus Pelethousia sp.]|nr:zinc-ribbon domain-containing protein [Candidatus Pelethousia sp.]
MVHCTNCGTQIEAGSRFCPSCGAAAPQSTTNSYQSGQSAYQSASNAYQGASNTYQPPVMRDSSDSADAQNNKVMGLLAYLGILVLVPIFAAKESRFARFHANQGLVLLIAEIAFSIIYSIVTSILANLLFSTGSFGVWGVLSTLLSLLSLVFFVLAIIGIINALNGKKKELPIIGKITILK